MGLEDVNRKLVSSRAAQYYYQDIRIHLEIDKFENKHVLGKYPKWDDVADSLKTVYLKYAISALRKEGKL